MRSHTLLVAAFALLFLLCPISAFCSGQTTNQHSLVWEQYYDEVYQGNAVKALIGTSDGGYSFVATNVPYGTGVAPNAILYKLDSLGVVEWQKKFDGSTTIAGLVQTSDDGYVSVVDGDLVKMDSRGNTQWKRPISKDYVVNSMIQSTDGGFALSVTITTQDFSSKIGLIKTDSEGKLEWETTYDEGMGDVSSQLIQTADGNYTIVGYTNTGNASRTDVNSKDLLLLKINASGGLVWRKTYNIGVSTSTDKSIVQTSDGGYVFTDNLRPVSIPIAIKTDSEGTIQWIKTYNDTGALAPPDVISPLPSGRFPPAVNSVIVTSDGGLAFAGSSDYQQIWIIKTDASGNSEWNQTYGDRGSYGYYENCFIESADGNFLVGGYWRLRNSGYQFYVAKIQADLPIPTPSPTLKLSNSLSVFSAPLDYIILVVIVLIFY